MSAAPGPIPAETEAAYAPEPPSIGVRWASGDGTEVRFLINRTQLHGEACLLCKRMDASLEDAGHVYTDAGGWRAKVCAGGCVAVAA